VAGGCETGEMRSITRKNRPGAIEIPVIVGIDTRLEVGVGGRSLGNGGSQYVFRLRQDPALIAQGTANLLSLINR